MKIEAIKKKTALLLIILITLAAVGARVIGLSYDHLVSQNHDERIHLFTAESIYGGILNPREIWEGRNFLYIFYPWLSMYIVAGVYHLRDLVLAGYSFLASSLIYLSGEGGSYLKGFTPPSAELDGRRALYLGRLTVALIGAVNIPLLYLVGKKLWNRRVGLLAAAILALSGYHIANCHWMKNDIIATFFLTVAFYFSVRIFLRGKIADYLLAAAFSAVAINTKHYNAPILASCLFAHLLPLPRLTFRGLLRRLLAAKFILFLLVFLVVLATTYPLLYLDFDYIISSFGDMVARTETHAMFGSLGTQARPRTFLQIRRDNLVNFGRFAWGMVAGMGPYVLLLGLGGIAASVWSREKRFLLAASFPLCYLPAAILVASPGVRYQDVIPLNPFFALLAAAFIYLAAKIISGGKRRLAAAVFTAAGIVLLVPYFRMTVSLNYGYWERSARYFASHWAARHIPPGSIVLRESKTLDLDYSRYKTARRVRALWDRDVNALAEAGIDYLATSSRYEGRALEETGLFGSEHPFGRFYLSLPSRYELIKEFDLGEIPYRGGSSKIWRLKKGNLLTPRGINSSFLRRLQHDLSFSSCELWVPDSSGRLEGSTSFIVPPDSRVVRQIVSLVPIGRFGVQVVNGPRAGTVRIRYGSEKLTEEFSAGEVRQFVVPARSGFPFIHHSYRVSVSAPWNSPCLVRVLTDPFRIGLGYYETGNYREAIPYLEEAARNHPGDWYPRALLAAAFGRAGEEEKAGFHRSGAEKIFPGWEAALDALDGETLSPDRWEGEFERLTGFSPRWLAERAGRIWYQDEWIEEPGESGRRVIVGEFPLPPGDYRIVLRGLEEGTAEGAGQLSLRIGYPGWVLGTEVPGGEIPQPLEFSNPVFRADWRLTVEGAAENISRLKEVVIHPGIDALGSRIGAYRRELNFGE